MPQHSELIVETLREVNVEWRPEAKVRIINAGVMQVTVMQAEGSHTDAVEEVFEIDSTGDHSLDDILGEIAGIHDLMLDPDLSAI